MSLKNLDMTLSSILYNEKEGMSIENSPDFLGSRSGNGFAPVRVFNAVSSPSFSAAQNSVPAS
jgi:hypothetical protein